MLFWRFFISAIILLPFWLFDKNKASFKNSIPVIIVSIFTFAVSSWLYIIAAKLIGTGLSMVLLFCFPLIVCFLNWFFKGITPSWLMFISIIGVIAGSYFLVDIQGCANPLGLIYALLAGVLYGFYIFWESQISISHIQSTFCVCFGSSFVFLFILFFLQSTSIPTIPENWLHPLILALVGTLLPMFFLLKSMKYISANYASIISVLEPITTILVSYFIMGECITTQQWIGTWIILVSVTLVQCELLFKEKAFYKKLSIKFTMR